MLTDSRRLELARQSYPEHNVPADEVADFFHRIPARRHPQLYHVFLRQGHADYFASIAANRKSHIDLVRGKVTYRTEPDIDARVQFISNLWSLFVKSTFNLQTIWLEQNNITWFRIHYTF